MLGLSIGDLSEAVEGQLSLGCLPPLAGKCEPIRRIVVECQDVDPGDVYWALVRPGYDGARLADTAFMRGALGVVVAGRPIEPWAGRFSILVPDTNTALSELANYLRHGDSEKSGTCRQSRSSTQLVQDWLNGQMVDLDAVLDRLPGGPDCVVA